VVVRHAVVSSFWHWWTCYVLYASTPAQRFRPQGNTYNNPLFNTLVKILNYDVDFNALNAELNVVCHLLVLLGDLTFMGPCIVSIFQYISNKILTLHSLFISGNCSTRFGWYFHLKRVEQFPDINKLCNVASSWIYIRILLGAHYILHISRIRVKRQVKSHLPSAGIIRSSPYSPR